MWGKRKKQFHRTVFSNLLYFAVADFCFVSLMLAHNSLIIFNRLFNCFVADNDCRIPLSREIKVVFLPCFVKNNLRVEDVGAWCGSKLFVIFPCDTDNDKPKIFVEISRTRNS